VFGYTLRRILLTIPVVLIAATIVFFIVQLMPGDIVDRLTSPDQGLPTTGLLKQKEKLGLDQPAHVQYWNWLRRILQGNMGYSLLTREPVIERIAQRVPATVTLMGTGMALGIGLAVPIGIVSATRQYSWLDHLITGFAFLAISIPAFFVGLGAIYVFALKLQLVPVGGLGTIGQESIADSVKHLIMPMTVVSLPYIARYARFVRSSMLEVVHEQYVQTARSKGLLERVVILKHALPNALIPVITMVGMSFPWVFSGSVVIEKVFNWPGIGMLTIDALHQRDYPVIVGLNLIFACLVLIGNLMADIAYGLVDPRIRYE